jgi:hypothetical protein
MQNSALIEKIRNLPPETAGEVEDFVDFLTEKKSKNDISNPEITIDEIAEHRAALSSFAEDWELPEMEIYDKL